MSMENYKDTVIYKGDRNTGYYWNFLTKVGYGRTEKRRHFVDKMTYDVLSLHHPDIAENPRASKEWGQIREIKRRAYHTASREKVLIILNELRLIK